MIRSIIKFVSVLALFMSFALIQPCAADAEVNVNIDIGPPPFFPLPLPPAVMVIPGSYVYFVPDVDVDILFYGGYWYRPHRNEWYRARDYNGPWQYVVPKRLPPPILRVPPGFRGLPPRHDRIPYKDLKRNWKGWEKKRHWDRDRGRDKDRGERKGRGKRR